MTCWLLLCLAFLMPVRALAMDYYVEGGVGLTQFQRTVPDGTWVQEAFPNRWDMTDRAFRAGAGLKLSDQWSIGFNYLDLGTVTVSTRYVADEAYDPINHVCVKNCALAKDLYTKDSLRGGELISTYTPWKWVVAPYLRGGLAGMKHSLAWETMGQWAELRGLIVMGAIGAGACYNNWLCADVTYYKGLGSTKFPVSQDALVPMVSIKLPF